MMKDEEKVEDWGSNDKTFSVSSEDSTATKAKEFHHKATGHMSEFGEQEYTGHA